jgi:pyrrolidone-carboxylate peptidase
MKFIALMLAAAGVAWSADTTAPIVLVTAYGPFDGRGINGSATLAKRLEGLSLAGAMVRTAVLPVVWGEPQARLPRLVAELKPVLLLGLGEGYPGRVVVERVGRNRAAGPDVAGHAPPAAAIEADGPAERRATLAFDAAWFTASPLPVSSSEDAGTYLCNALLYSALAQPVAKIGFAHLPPQGTTPDDEYCAASLPAVRALIERNLEPKPR